MSELVMVCGAPCAGAAGKAGAVSAATRMAGTRGAGGSRIGVRVRDGAAGSDALSITTLTVEASRGRCGGGGGASSAASLDRGDHAFSVRKRGWSLEGNTFRIQRTESSTG